MQGDLRIEFGRPSNGWIHVRINHAEQELEMDASYVPFDSVKNLAEAVSMMLKGGPEAIVTWNEEPTETEFRFTRNGEQVSLAILRFPNSRRSAGNGKCVMELQASALHICTAIWRALRRLQADLPSAEYKVGWGHRFPEEELEEIGQMINQSKTS